MNRKQFLTLIVVALAVGALGFYFYNQRKGSFSSGSIRSGKTVLKDFPLNDVAHIRVKQAGGEVNLVRGDVWTVKERWGYPASFEQVSGFLRTIWELEPVQNVQAGPSQFGRLDLLAPSGAGTNSAGTGTLVEFLDGKDSALQSIVLGKMHMKESPAGQFGRGGEFPAGRYVLVPGEEARVWLVSEPFSNIKPEPADWLDKDFFKVEKVKSVSVTYPEAPTNSWTILREMETGEWKLQDAKPGENFEPSKASALGHALASPSFDDVVSPDAKPEEIGMANPVVARLETFDGLIYTVRVGSTNGDNVYLSMDLEANLQTERAPAGDEKPEDKERLDKEFNDTLEKLQAKVKNEEQFEKWTYLASKWTIDSLLKDRAEFMAEETKEEDASASVEEDSAAAPPLPVIPPIETVPPVLKGAPTQPATNTP